jgi:hypothetical protein
MTTKVFGFWLLLGNSMAVLSAFVIDHYSGADSFGEKGFITVWSTFQLLAIALLSDKIAQKRTQRRLRDNSAMLWRVIAWGFIFLAADEFLGLHESADLLIHDFFSLRTTGLSDRIDDLIIGSYGVVGAGVIFVIYRLQLKSVISALPFFKLGFLFLFLMVTVDIVTNGNELIDIMANHEEVARQIYTFLGQLEESLKVFSEASFILAFHSVLKHCELEKLLLSNKVS